MPGDGNEPNALLWQVANAHIANAARFHSHHQVAACSHAHKAGSVGDRGVGTHRICQSQALQHCIQETFRHVTKQVHITDKLKILTAKTVGIFSVIW